MRVFGVGGMVTLEEKLRQREVNEEILMENELSKLIG